MKSTHTRSQLIIVTDNCSKCFFKRYKILSWYYISPKMWKCQISAKKKFPGSTKKVLHNFRWLLGNFWGCNLQKPPESYKECKIFFCCNDFTSFCNFTFSFGAQIFFQFSLTKKKEEKSSHPLSQYVHSNLKKKLGFGDKYHRSIKVHT